MLPGELPGWRRTRRACAGCSADRSNAWRCFVWRGGRTSLYFRTSVSASEGGASHSEYVATLTRCMQQEMVRRYHGWCWTAQAGACAAGSRPGVVLSITTYVMLLFVPCARTLWCYLPLCCYPHAASWLLVMWHACHAVMPWQVVVGSSIIGRFGTRLCVRWR